MTTRKKTQGKADQAQADEPKTMTLQYIVEMMTETIHEKAARLESENRALRTALCALAPLLAPVEKSEARSAWTHADGSKIEVGSK